jgi:molecular chaperone GrpE
MTKHKHEHQDTPADEPRATQPAGGPMSDEPVAAAGDECGRLKAERDDLLARLQRVSADYLNYQKRIQRDIEQAREYGNETLIRAIVPVLDDMERALEHARANHAEDDPLVAGMQLVHDKLLDTLGRFGLTVIQSAGKPFDPALHSALMQQESADVPEMTVLKEAARGYQLKGRTIRPAQVVVSKAPTR